MEAQGLDGVCTWKWLGVGCAHAVDAVDHMMHRSGWDLGLGTGGLTFYAMWV